LHRRFRDNFFINFLGTWSENTGRSIPTGGLAYYLSPPNDLNDIINDPLHVITYVTFILTCCG